MCLLTCLHTLWLISWHVRALVFRHVSPCGSILEEIKQLSMRIHCKRKTLYWRCVCVCVWGGGGKGCAVAVPGGPQATKFSLRATRKLFFYKARALGTLDIMVVSFWPPCDSSKSTALATKISTSHNTWTQFPTILCWLPPPCTFLMLHSSFPP